MLHVVCRLKLSSQHCWWRGPEFLWEVEESGPSTNLEEVSDSEQEVRPSTDVRQISVGQHCSDSHSPDDTSRDNA